MKSALRLAICSSLLFAFSLHAQRPDKNVNMVSGTDFATGDPFLQRQNEGSIAAGTRNVFHLMGGANDYRTVDLPGLPDDEETGDAWLAWFKSTDGGLSWFSGLIPGYQQDPLKTPPLYGFHAGADPMVRSGFNGMFYYSGLALDRAPIQQSAVFVTRFNDFNNLEHGDPIKLIGTSIVFDGRPAVFADKPTLAVDFPRLGQSLVCSVGGQTILGGNVYVAYTIVSPDQTLAKMWFARSTDCAKTWSSPILISGNNTLNQGSVMAIDTMTGTVYVAWRRILPTLGSPQTDAIMLTKSTDGGKTFSAPIVVRNITPFEQGTTTKSFRTRAYPAMITDASGRIYIAWSERVGGPAGDGRVMLTSSTNGTSWSAPVTVAPYPGRGHQFMPALSFSSSKLMLVYYDLREDSTIGRFKPVAVPAGSYIETRRAVGDLATMPASPDKVFNRWIAEAIVDPVSGNLLPGTLLRRHTLDVRAAQASPGALPVFDPSQRVSRYAFGSTSASPIDPETGNPAIDQMGFNPPNLPMFKQGTVPFFGDYLDISPQYPFLGSIFNNLPIPPPAFHAVWTDNRDVRAPKDGNWANYTPVGVNGVSKFDPSKTVAPCVAGQTGMRNQNIYTSRITAGITVGSPGNAKQTGRIQRTFVVVVQNTKDASQSYRLLIVNQPIGGKASFIQFPLNAAAVTTLDVTVNAKSSTSRPVFVSSILAHNPVGVIVQEITGVGGTVPPNGLTSATVLNGDITTPDLGNSGPPGNPDIGNSEVYNPDLGNGGVENPDLGNAGISAPDLGNPDLGNPDLGNPDLGNPDLGNPDLGNPDLGNPDLGNPDLGNADIANGSMSDTTWDVTDTGNTTASYSVKLLKTDDIPSAYKLQLLLHYPYRTPVADGCTLKTRRHDNLINNVPHPVISLPTDGNLASPDLGNATIPTVSIAPGESVNVTVRVVDPFHKGVTIDASKFLTPVIVAHAINTADLNSANPRPPIALVITTSSLPDGVTGSTYRAAMSAIGGLAPLRWDVVPTDGTFTGFPPGLTIGTNGLITGAPTSPGTYGFTMRVTDSTPQRPHVATRRFIVHVADPLVISTKSLPGGIVGTSYLATLGAQGGLLPLNWTTVGGSLPPGLSLAPDGTISGRPTAAGPSQFVVSVSDSSSPKQSASQQFTIQITALSLNIEWVVQPTTTTTGQAINPPVQVRIRDNSGAVLPGVNVTMSIGSNPGGASFTPQQNLTDATGIATFPQIVINSNGVGYTLLASAAQAGYAPASSASDPFGVATVTPGSATAGFGQLVAIQAVGLPDPTNWDTLNLQIRFSQGTSSVRGFAFNSPSSSDVLFARLPFQGDNVDNGTLAPGGALIDITWSNGALRGVPITVSTTPGKPTIRFALELVEAPNANDPCGSGFLSPTPADAHIDTITPGQGIGISAFGIDTTGAVAVFEQGDNVVEVSSLCTLTTNSVGSVATFGVPSSLVPGDVLVFLKTTVNGTTSATSDSMTLHVVAPVAYRCIGAPFYTFNNWNIAGVVNGGTAPNFGTNGPQCLVAIDDYHWNDGQGVQPGTIGLVVISDLGTITLGPWTAVGSNPQGQNSPPFVNWEATPDTPTVLDGGYRLLDSSTDTWSSNAESKGFGFSKVLVKTAVPSAHP